MARLAVVLLAFSVLLVGCGNPVGSFEGQVGEIRDKAFLVGCSDAANKGKQGVIPLIGYLCNVQYTEKTLFRDVNGKSLKSDDISQSSTVNIILEKPVDIRKSIEKNQPIDLTAKEIVMLQESSE